MLPIISSVEGISISSFSVFLALGFLLGIFLVWRLCRAWDLPEEKILDLTLLAFIGGLIGARVYFVLAHLELFSSPLNLILISKIPGFSVWGGVLGGWLTLYFFARRYRMDFWQLLDIASVGFLGGLILADLGCFLGGCNVGAASKAFFALTMAGVSERRLPTQAIEALLLFLSLLKIWSLATHFHQRGKIASLGLIYIGIIKLMLEPFKQDHSEAVLVGVYLILGLIILYKVTKQNPVTQLKNLVMFLIKFMTEVGTRETAMQHFGKSWYNQKVTISWKIRNLKKLLRRSNVKFS